MTEADALLRARALLQDPPPPQAAGWKALSTSLLMAITGVGAMGAALFGSAFF